MTRFAKSLLIGLPVLAALYWVPVNLGLNLPAARDALNRVQPDHWHLDWASAWSLVPMRVELRGLAADGQTPKAQWQLDAGGVGATLSLVALLRGEVRVSDVDLTDVEVRLRSLPEPNAASATVTAMTAESLPSIRNRSPDATARPQAAGGKGPGGLRLAVADLRLRGEHRFWVNQFRGVVDGGLGGSFALDLGTGELELTDGSADLLLRSLAIAGVPDPTGDARLAGRVEVPRTALADLADPTSLRRIEIDAEVDIPVHNLAFIGVLVGDLGALELTGRGRLTGRIVNRDARLQRGTAFSVDAAELALSWSPYRFSGDGEVELRLEANPTEQDQAALDVTFARVEGALVQAPPAGDDADAAPVELQLFRGQGLEAGLRVPLVDEDGPAEKRLDPRVEISIPEVSVPDLSVYNALLPPQWGLALRGGDGNLSLRATLDAQTLRIALELVSKAAAVGLADYLGRGDLALEFKAKAERGAAATLDLAGSKLRLSEVRIDQGTAGGEPPEAGDAAGAASWDAEMLIETARLSVPEPAAADDDISLASLARELAAEGFSPVLARADGEVTATLTISRLDWIGALLRHPLGFQLEGSGLVAADLVLKQGWPAVGTRLRISPQDLRVGILEYIVEGDGAAALNLLEGGKQPRASLSLDIENGRMRRGDAPQASIDEVALGLEVAAPLADEAAAKDTTVGLTIKSAHIKDVAAFNAYLPPNAPVRIDSGEAGLAGGLALSVDSASGELLLEAREIGLTAAKNALLADALLTLNVRGGSPVEMRFDVGGSALRLENVRVRGETQSHEEAGWSARLQLDDTELVWDRPMRLDLTAGIKLEDTRPVVAILDNMRGKHDWISRLLEAQGLTGHLSLVLDEQSATVRDARVLTDQVGVRLKGRSDASGREAMLFIRYGQLAGALSQRDERRRFSILKARDRFDAYSPGQTALEVEGVDDRADSWAGEIGGQAPGAAETAPEMSSAEAPAQKGRSEEDTQLSQPVPSPFLNSD